MCSSHFWFKKKSNFYSHLLYSRIEFHEVLLADYTQDSTLACLAGKTTILGDLLAGVLPSNGMICNLTHTQQQQCPAGDGYQECTHRRFCQRTWDTQRQFIYLLTSDIETIHGDQNVMTIKKVLLANVCKHKII